MSAFGSASKTHVLSNSARHSLLCLRLIFMLCALLLFDDDDDDGAGTDRDDDGTDDVDNDILGDDDAASVDGVVTFSKKRILKESLNKRSSRENTLYIHIYIICI